MANFFESLYYTDPISIVLPFISISILLFFITKHYFSSRFNGNTFVILISAASAILVTRLFITLTSYLGSFGYILRIISLIISVFLIFYIKKQNFKYK